MNLTDYNEIRALLFRHGFRFEKSKGQNFLVADWVPERIADAAGLDQKTGVVEIGPGVGCLTEQLAKRAGKVLCYELDTSLEPVLVQTLAAYAQTVELQFTDVMRRDLAADALQRLPGLRPVLCANLPYNITTPVLSKVYEARCFDAAVVMIQKEVAQRLCAGPGSGDYGAFSVYTRWFAEPELLFTVPADCFHPRPKVTSAVVRLNFRKEPPEAVEEAAFFKTVRAAFGQRRKTLANALSVIWPKEAALAAIKACGFDERIRGEMLGIPEFAALTKQLQVSINQ